MQRQLAAAAKGESIDGSDGGLGTRFESTEDDLARPGAPLRFQRRLAFQFRDVRARHERPARSGEQYRAHVVAGVRFVDGDPELGDRGIVQRVQLVRTVDRDRGDAVGNVEGQELIGHGGRVRSGV